MDSKVASRNSFTTTYFHKLYSTIIEYSLSQRVGFYNFYYYKEASSENKSNIHLSVLEDAKKKTQSSLADWTAVVTFP